MRDSGRKLQLCLGKAAGASSLEGLQWTDDYSGLDFLVGWQIPAELQCERFGVRHFHHPTLVAAIDALSPEVQLLRFIDEVLFSCPGNEPWVGTADQLERRLRTGGGPYGIEARKLFSYNSACGVYLGRLRKRYPERFTMRKGTRSNVWEIQAPVDLQA